MDKAPRGTRAACTYRANRSPANLLLTSSATLGTAVGVGIKVRGAAGADCRRRQAAPCIAIESFESSKCFGGAHWHKASLIAILEIR